MALNEFKNNFNGGTRANRFEISGNLNGWGNFNISHVRAATVPEVSSKSIAYDHFGRKHYYPGEKQYGAWSFSVLDDDPTNSTGALWEMFQTWQNKINHHATNEYAYGGGAGYKQEDGISIKHLNINGDKVLKEFVIYGAWPQAILPIKFNMTNPNVLNTFSVTMVYDSIEIYADDGGMVTEPI
jgi:hypothetical protein